MFAHATLFNFAAGLIAVAMISYYFCRRCPYSVFIDKIINKLREQNLHQVAAKLLKNRREVIQYLKQNNWNTSDMTGQWDTAINGDTCFGKMAHNDLFKNTKGVRIIPGYGVSIAYWSQYGYWTKPMIRCDEGGFDIIE